MSSSSGIQSHQKHNVLGADLSDASLPDAANSDAAGVLSFGANDDAGPVRATAGQAVDANVFASLVDSAGTGVPNFAGRAPVDSGPVVGPSSNAALGADIFTGSSIDPATVAGGATLEIAAPYSGTVSFAQPTGTLKIDNSASFSGTIAGQLALGNAIDLTDITAGSKAILSYSGNDSSGTLTVSDGINNANIAFTGAYSLSNFTASSDGKGGTVIVDPPIPSSNTLAGLPLDANGWLVTAPQPNSRIIYVSSSTGNDSNSGLSSNSAVATLAAGEALLRDGSPDQLLLKAGDTWVNQSFDYLRVSGQSAAAPMVIGTYGTGAAPVIETPDTGIGIGALGGTQPGGDFLVIEGLNFYAYQRDPNNPAYAGPSTSSLGTRFLSPITDLVIAGCTFSYYTTDIVIDASSTGPSSSVTLYRNSIINAWDTNGHSQGVYIAGIANPIIEQNVFNQDGWNPSIPGAEATVFNHNVYLQSTDGPVVFSGNISANSSTDGVMARSGGTITNNLFVKDAMGPIVGVTPGSDGPGVPVPVLTSSVVSGNVILEATDIQSSPPLPRSMGITVSNATGSGVQITGNIIANPDPAAQTVNQHGIDIDNLTSGINATNNIIYGFALPINDAGTGNITSSNAINQSGYLDPTRSVETYDAAVLGGPGTLADFLAKVEAQNPANPNPALTAAAVNAYIQAGAGFSLAPAGPTPTSILESPSTGDLSAGKTVMPTLNMSTAQSSDVPAEIMNDPTVTALDQQLALFSQHMASAFPSSAFGNDNASIASTTELGGAQHSQIAQPVASQQHV